MFVHHIETFLDYFRRLFLLSIMWNLGLDAK